MITQLQPDSNIPLQVYELATSHGIGTPLKGQRRRVIQILIIIVGIFMLWWLGYTIYGYIALHDTSWQDMLQYAATLLGLMSQYSIFSSAYRTKLYMCTDGLLKIYKQKDEAVRWDEVKELYIANGNVTRLVKQDGSDFLLPQLLMSGLDKTLNTLIIDEVARCLLPGMLASYERGETVTFGGLEINQKGIYRPGGVVYWRQVGDIALEKQTLSVYYSKLDNGPEQVPTVFAGKWHTWRKSALTLTSWPNLPVFVVLVNTILDQRGVNQMEKAPLSQQPRTLKETAALMKRRSRRRKRVAIATTIVSILGILSLVIGVAIYQSVQQQQRFARDTQLLRTYFSKLAHQSYAVHVPGEHCDTGKKFWLDDDPKNVYACQNDGLLMTQKNMQYVDGEWFTFVPDTLSTMDAFSSVSYFPHNYRVQVKATILSGGPGTCVSVAVHVQDFQGNQSFDVCADGSWGYYRCDLHCNTDTLVTSGNLPRAHNTYLITVDVTDSVVSLRVDHTKITSINDSTYTSTDQLELALYGSQNAHEPITALFSDFSYLPSV